MPLLPPSWAMPLDPVIRDGRLAAVLAAVDLERTKEPVFPPDRDVLRALELTPFDRVSVVILGQDPYHGAGQAHGLAFSVPDGIRTPPSLRNIRQELTSDLGHPPRITNDLTSWAAQGVLLLNSTLTVSEGRAGSHSSLGWEAITDTLVDALSKREQPLAFLLWGAPAQKKASRVDAHRHLVLQAPHPSPLSAYRGFFGCRHFTQANAFLARHGRPPIEW